MAGTRIIRYIVSHPDYHTEYHTCEGGMVYKNFQSPKTMAHAIRWAARMGNGALIERLYVNRSGKRKVTAWIHKSD